MKKLLLLTIGILLVCYANADIPDGYYNSANGLTGDALTSALHNIIDNHTVKSYGEARYILDESDQDPANSSNLILIYKGTSISSNWDAGASWNREHVWSKSHGFPDEGDDIPYSDLHNLKPSHPTVNTNRSDKDFEEGGTQHNIATECFYTSDTWEPRDDVKGDVARIMLYMVIRYNGDETGEPDLELVDNITSYPNPEFGIVSTLLQWHYQDPVDNFEKNRNDVIYTYQNNRNPFIDHPEYVSKIWGGGYSNPAPSISNIINTPSIPTSTETVSITANITDDVAVTEAEMHWGLIPGALINTISLTNTSGDIYTADTNIPSQNDGTIVYYEIEATDDSSGVTTTEELNFEIDNNPPAIILDEDFTSCPATGWTSYSVSGTEDWECSANGYFYINAYGGDEASSDWIISPSVDLNVYNDEYLTFSSWTNYSDVISPTIELKYSTDYSGSGDPTSANWIDLSTTWSDVGSQEWTESGKVDLSNITGTNVYIAFRYTSSGTTSGTCAIWEIDNVYISETANILPQITELSNLPVTPIAGEDVIVSATITDFDGTVSAGNIKWGTTSGLYPNTVVMSNSGDIYTGTIPSQAEGTFVYYIIEARDNSAEIRLSRENTFSYNTTGNSLPSITNIIISPDAPTASDGVTISSTITDTDGSILIAQMKWGTAPDNYEYNVELIKDNDTYSGFIPSRAENTEIYFVIYSVDNDGGLTQSIEDDYIVNNPPRISNIVFIPENPTEGETVEVSASVTDANVSITSVVLKWKTDIGNFTDVTMNYSNNKYTGTIPSQTAGENILFSIEATDNLGAISIDSTGQYIVSENTPPEISNVVINPENPTALESVTISANVSDANGSLTSVVLKWKEATGTYANINMNASNDLYTGTIPAQEAGDSIIFSIEATDNLGIISVDSSGYYKVAVDDPPEISDIVINPENPTAGENVVVSVSVFDAIGSVTSVVLKWKTAIGTYTDVNMNFSSNRYSGVIPGQADGENISFSIEATDNIGGVSSDTTGYYEVSGANDILDIHEKIVSIYPIPTNDILNIEVEDYNGILEVQIYNIIGGLVYTEESDIIKSKKLSLSKLESGIYFVKINFDNKNYTQKILIKK